MNTALWQPVEDVAALDADVRGWLVSHMNDRCGWLLVHADDGVIWGRREPDGSLLLSSDVFDLKSQYPAIAVELRSQTIQQARVFGEEGELLIWREGTRLRGRIIRDGEAVPDIAWQEQHLLWGTANGRPDRGFTLLVEGKQGPQHAVPLAVSGRQRVALTVRHYVAADENGRAAIVLSRLVDLGLYAPQRGG